MTRLQRMPKVLSLLAFAKDGRTRLILWATAISMLLGAIGATNIIDDYARHLRIGARHIEADGQIVVIGIDEDSVRRISQKYPWSHDVDAALIEKLSSLGAKRIFFDRAMVDLDTPAADATLVAMLKRHYGQVFFGTRILFSNGGEASGRWSPAKPFIENVKLADFGIWRNTMGHTTFTPFATASNGVTFPSMSALLANRQGPVGEWFRPDYAIDYRTIPVKSSADVLQGKVSRSEILGKDVVLGVTSESLGDVHFLPWFGQVQGVFVHVIAAQTLKSGNPVDFGSSPAFIVSLILSILFVFCKRRWQKWLAVVFQFILCGLLPIVLDAHLISGNIGAGLFLFTVVAIRHARAQFGIRKSTTNTVSGLPNLNALRQDRATMDDILVAAKVQNFAGISASFKGDVEKLMILEIAKRLVIGQQDVPVYQGDDGCFFWHTPSCPIAELVDHLEGLHGLFADPVVIGDRPIDVSISFGFDCDVTRPVASRIASAVLSAEEAIRAGTKWKAFDPGQMADAEWKFSIGSRLDIAMSQKEIWVAYQPKLDLRNNRIIGAEALARWNHPQRGPISPDEFIPAAESSHRIKALTHYIFVDAVAAAKRMRCIDPDFTIAVNLAAPLLKDADLPEKLVRQLADANLSTSALMLEITESVLLEQTDTTRDNLLALREAGFGISIDDYGTGFSTLDYLTNVPANEVKIDRKFTSGVRQNGKDRIVVRSTIEMAHLLGFTVVAEGVEDGETLRALSAVGCDVGQGFHIGRPVELAKLIARLEQKPLRRFA